MHAANVEGVGGISLRVPRAFATGIACAEVGAAAHHDASPGGRDGRVLQHLDIASPIGIAVSPQNHIACVGAQRGVGRHIDTARGLDQQARAGGRTLQVGVDGHIATIDRDRTTDADGAAQGDVLGVGGLAQGQATERAGIGQLGCVQCIGKAGAAGLDADCPRGLERKAAGRRSIAQLVGGDVDGAAAAGYPGQSPTQHRRGR